ncbi:carboxylating nicotinate-nucleotide diphosphorylase [Naumannella huperziae]
MTAQLDRPLGAPAPPSAEEIARVVELAVAEDLALGPDVTTAATIAEDAEGVADVVARSCGVLAGVGVAAAAFAACARASGGTVRVEELRSDGDPVAPGETVLVVSGSLRTILTAERTALNLLGQLSGVASLTARWVEEAAALGASVRDTRKTVPGLRPLQKYAVRCGGGLNHRMGLGDAALIKDNHIAAAGSVTAALDAVRAAAPELPIEVECDTLDQVDEALAAGARMILLDNMAGRQVAEAVRRARAAGARTEASGGLHLGGACELAGTGVDYLAVGELTHSAPALDVGLDLR